MNIDNHNILVYLTKYIFWINNIIFFKKVNINKNTFILAFILKASQIYLPVIQLTLCVVN